METHLRSAISQAVADCFANKELDSGVVPEIHLEIPANKDHGDFSTNVAMVLARAERKAPRKIAEKIIGALGDGGGLWSRVDIAGAGFINFVLAPDCWYQIVRSILQQPASYGRSNIGSGKKIQVEFVSANPTGPLHIGHGRGAATGDAVATVLSAAGYDVQREYYVNDAGNQMLTLGRSIYLRYIQSEEFPEDCYQGSYIRDIAVGMAEEHGEALQNLPEDEAVRLCAAVGGELIRQGIAHDLDTFGVHFDNWFSEQSLYDSQKVEAGISLIKEQGLAYENEGAIWFRTTDTGDDKDRVLVRSNGDTTYFASDVAYHKDKFERGFDTVIDVWGADHHGYIPRMKAMVQALGRSADDLQVLLVQLVNLQRDGVQVAMSTRSGEFVTLEEVVREVGRDACRFFFLMRRSDSHLDFDLELAKKQSNENPVFYVQYAHARICSIQRNAEEQGVKLPTLDNLDLSGLIEVEELGLIKTLARYPSVVEGAAQAHEPHRIAFYLQEIAAQFHSYYNKQKVLVEDSALSQARLCLVSSVRIVVANALALLGVSAPEKM